MEGNDITIAALWVAIVCGSTLLAIAYWKTPSAYQSIMFDLGLDFILVPSVSMLLFLLVDWRAAVMALVLRHILGIAGFVRFATSGFSQKEVATKPLWQTALRSVIWWPAVAAVLLDRIDLLRPIPFISASVLLLLAPFNTVPRRSHMTGIMQTAASMGFALLVVAWAGACELLWRYGTFEYWLWLFSYQVPVISLAGLCATGLLVLLVRTYAANSR